MDPHGKLLELNDPSICDTWLERYFTNILAYKYTKNLCQQMWYVLIFYITFLYQRVVISMDDVMFFKCSWDLISCMILLENL